MVDQLSPFFPNIFFENGYRLTRQLPTPDQQLFPATARQMSSLRGLSLSPAANHPLGPSEPQRLGIALNGDGSRLRYWNSQPYQIVTGPSLMEKAGLASTFALSLLSIYRASCSQRQKWGLALLSSLLHGLAYRLLRRPMIRKHRALDWNSLGRVTRAINNLNPNQWFTNKVGNGQLLAFAEYLKQLNTRVLAHNQRLRQSWLYRSIRPLINLEWQTVNTSPWFNKIIELNYLDRESTCPPQIDSRAAWSDRLSNEDIDACCSALNRSMLNDAEAWLNRRLIGQKEATAEIASAIRKWGLGYFEENKPKACFFFYGPTGSGKTQSAKLTAEYLGLPLVRIGMEKFKERHSDSGLFGSPPGFVGSDEMGRLLRDVQKHPKCVLLLDEFDKAHPDVQKAFLSILDEGEDTDMSTGKKVDFRNCLIIMTSNNPNPQLYYKLQGIPELAGRLSAIIGFKRAGSSVLKGIIAQKIGQILQRTARQSAANGTHYRFPWNPSSTEAQSLVNYFYENCKPENNPYGIRRVEKVIFKALTDLLSKEQLSELPPQNGTHITFLYDSYEKNLKMRVSQP